MLTNRWYILVKELVLCISCIHDVILSFFFYYRISLPPAISAMTIFLMEKIVFYY